MNESVSDILINVLGRGPRVFINHHTFFSEIYIKKAWAFKWAVSTRTSKRVCPKEKSANLRIKKMTNRPGNRGEQITHTCTQTHTETLALPACSYFQNIKITLQVTTTSCTPVAAWFRKGGGGGIVEMVARKRSLTFTHKLLHGVKTIIWNPLEIFWRSHEYASMAPLLWLAWRPRLEVLIVVQLEWRSICPFQATIPGFPVQSDEKIGGTAPERNKYWLHKRKQQNWQDKFIVLEKKKKIPGEEWVFPTWAYPWGSPVMWRWSLKPESCRSFRTSLSRLRSANHLGTAASSFLCEYQCTNHLLELQRNWTMCRTSSHVTDKTSLDSKLS